MTGTDDRHAGVLYVAPGDWAPACEDAGRERGVVWVELRVVVEISYSEMMQGRLKRSGDAMFGHSTHVTESAFCTIAAFSVRSKGAAALRPLLRRQDLYLVRVHKNRRELRIVE